MRSLIRDPLPNGDEQILMTSLIDLQKYPYEIFRGLYHQRWGVEESFKQMKCRMQVENFTGKTVRSIEQDFYGRILSMNLTAVLAHPVQEALERDGQTRKHPPQVNFTFALSCMKKTIVSIFCYNHAYDLCQELLELIYKNPEPVRPGRKYPRHPVRRDRMVFFAEYKSPA